MGGDQSVNFESLKVEVAAQDSDLVALLQLKMMGYTDESGITESRKDLIDSLDTEQQKQLLDDVRRYYHLSSDEFRKAYISCIARVTNLKLASEL